MKSKEKRDKMALDIQINIDSDFYIDNMDKFKADVVAIIAEFNGPINGNLELAEQQYNECYKKHSNENNISSIFQCCLVQGFKRSYRNKDLEI